MEWKLIRKNRMNVLLQQVLKEYKFSCWLVLTREGSRDPLSSDLGLENVVGKAAGLYYFQNDRLEKLAVCAAYDIESIENSRLYDQVIAYKKEGIWTHLSKIMEDNDFKNIFLNYSRDIPLADGISLGLFNLAKEKLPETYVQRFQSSEPIIVAFRSMFLAEEIEILEKNVKITQEIITDVLQPGVIKPGLTTEKDVAGLLAEKASSIQARIPFCTVESGHSRGHSEPSDKIIQKGEILSIDFGITLNGYNSDIQRCAYILNDKETVPPDYIENIFKTTREANQKAIAMMKPGVKAFEIDNIAREYITQAGYPEYLHASGHTLGREVHDAGPVLGPDWPEKYGTSVHYPLKQGMVFAVEPMIYEKVGNIVVHCGLEEDVVIEQNGARIIGDPQTKLILI